MNDATWCVMKEADWLSLFFLNVIPFNSKYHLCCEICGDSFPVTAAFARTILNPEKRDQALHDQVVKGIEQHQFEGLTEVQMRRKREKFSK